MERNQFDRVEQVGVHKSNPKLVFKKDKFQGKNKNCILILNFVRQWNSFAREVVKASP